MLDWTEQWFGSIKLELETPENNYFLNILNVLQTTLRSFMVMLRLEKANEASNENEMF